MCEATSLSSSHELQVYPDARQPDIHATRSGMLLRTQAKRSVAFLKWIKLPTPLLSGLRRATVLGEIWTPSGSGNQNLFSQKWSG